MPKNPYIFRIVRKCTDFVRKCTDFVRKSENGDYLKNYVLLNSSYEEMRSFKNFLEK